MQYPFTKEVCDLFDVCVLTDLEDVADKPVPVYALGCRSELGAGLRGFSMSPYFVSVELLESFCEKHIERFRAMMEGFYKLIRIHDLVWLDKTLPLAHRIEVCDLLWRLAISLCKGE